MSLTHPVLPPEPGDRCLRIRALLACCGVITVFGALAFRLYDLQVGRHEHFLGELRKHRTSQTLDASRGTIFDTRSRLLAVDEPVQQVAFDMGFLQKGSKLAESLVKVEGMPAQDLRHAFSLRKLQEKYISHLARLCAAELGMTPAAFEEKLRIRLEKRSDGELPLSREVSVSAALKIRADLQAAEFGNFRENGGQLGALVFRNNFSRSYPTNVSLTHIVGKYGEPGRQKDTDPILPPQGVAGAEKFFEEQLKGTTGRREFEVDGWNNEIPAYRGKVIPAQNGKNVRLSLDLGLQTILEAEMDATGEGEGEVYLNEVNAQRVIVVLFDPATMGVRAIACRDKHQNKNKPLLSNPASEFLYEPGSTIKIATVSIALDAGKVRKDTIIPIPQGGYYNKGDVQAFRDDHYQGNLSVTDVLVYSSNIGAFELARKVGPRKYEERLWDFGFCQRAGFESPYENRGYTPENRKGDTMGRMTLQTLSRVAYGNAILVTPAQMCGALGCVINEGKFRPLHLAEAWVDEKGGLLETMEKGEGRQVISPSTSQIVRAAMLQVVERGSGKPGRSELFSIAGKTGTAQKATTVTVQGKNGPVQKSEYLRGDYICSFIGFAPAEKPRLAGLVIVDMPKSQKYAHYGGKIAAPIFRRVIEKALAYYEVAQQFFPAVRNLPQSAANAPSRERLRAGSR